MSAAIPVISVPGRDACRASCTMRSSIAREVFGLAIRIFMRVFRRGDARHCSVAGADV
jgi:hypothetical protein